MAKKQIDGDGLDIPNRIKALPVKRTGPIVAAVIVALIAAMLLQGLITNPRFEWNVVWKYLFDENVREGIKYTLLLTVISMVIAIIQYKYSISFIETFFGNFHFLKSSRVRTVNTCHVQLFFSF